jgi:hypothetical protein
VKRMWKPNLVEPVDAADWAVRCNQTHIAVAVVYMVDIANRNWEGGKLTCHSSGKLTEAASNPPYCSWSMNTAAVN